MQGMQPNNHRHIIILIDIGMTHCHFMVTGRKYPSTNMRTCCMDEKQVYLLSLFMALLQKM